MLHAGRRDIGLQKHTIIIAKRAVFRAETAVLFPATTFRIFLERHAATLADQSGQCTFPAQ